jgi:DNA-binding NarL/FixJ family response regulator
VSVRVLIADDFELVRDGIEIAPESHPEIEVVGTGEDGREAISRARELRPAVVVLDLRISRHGGWRRWTRSASSFRTSGSGF